MLVVAACAKLVAKLLGRADRYTWLGFAVIIAAAVSQGRIVMDSIIRLNSGPLDPDLSILTMPTDDVLKERLRGTSVLCVGCTKGIGRGIVDALHGLDTASSIAIVGRSNVSHILGFRSYAFDLSTYRGCQALGTALKEDGTKYDLIFFTVGVWPDFSNPLTDDGVERVVAIDLLARHLILQDLHTNDLLRDDTIVLNTLASTQHFPFLSKFLVQRRLSHTKKPSFITALAPVAIAADAYLPAASYHFPKINAIAGIFPGIVVTDLPRSTFPDWALPYVQAIIRPFSISALASGRAHLAIAASPDIRKKPVSYWNHLLEGRRAHVLAYDTGLIEFVWDFLTNTSNALHRNHTSPVLLNQEGQNDFPPASSSSSSSPPRHHQARGGGVSAPTKNDGAVDGDAEEFF